MTSRQALIYSLLYLAIIVFGAFIAFKITWTQGNERYLGIIAFFSVGFGSLFLAISLTRLLISTKIDFNFSILSDKNNYNVFRAKVGSFKVRLINITYVSLFLIIFLGTAYIYYRSIKIYEYNQLMAFGQIQKVKIKDIQYKGKGTRFAVFDYYLKGHKFTNDLRPKGFIIGDSSSIIFSIENPDIVKWEDDFNKSSK